MVEAKKRKGNRKKGQLSERKAVADLEKQGFQWIYRVKGSTRFNKNVDIFGIWDTVAIKREEIGEPLVKIIRKWIQVKTNRKLTKKEQIPYGKFVRECCDANDHAELWNYKDRKKGVKKPSCDKYRFVPQPKKSFKMVLLK